MSRRADVVCETAGDSELAVPDEQDSGVGPASMKGPMMTTAVWPLQSSLELGALPEAVPSARLHAKLVTREWGLPELANTVELIVSELVTNSVQASAGLTGSRYNGRWQPGRPPVRLWLQSDGEHVLVQVWDASHELPVPQEADLDAEHGRGLSIVAAMSERYGAYSLEGGNGKVVWALCRGPDAGISTLTPAARLEMGA